MIRSKAVLIAALGIDTRHIAQTRINPPSTEPLITSSIAFTCFQAPVAITDLATPIGCNEGPALYSPDDGGIKAVEPFEYQVEQPIEQLTVMAM
jgi:hypothetical protein